MGKLNFFAHLCITDCSCTVFSVLDAAQLHPEEKGEKAPGAWVNNHLTAHYFLSELTDELK